MKRDMDLVRKILQEVEESDRSIAGSLDIDGYDEDLIDYHVLILNEADLLDADLNTLEDGTVIVMSINRLTWNGHEFLDAAKNDKIWNQAKEISKKKGYELPFQILQSLLFSLLKSVIMPD